MNQSDEKGVGARAGPANRRTTSTPVTLSSDQVRMIHALRASVHGAPPKAAARAASSVHGVARGASPP